MLREWERRYPGRMETIFRSLRNVEPSHLADARLFDFAGLAPTGVPVAGRRYRRSTPSRAEPDTATVALPAADRTPAYAARA